ncbi:MAG: HEPN domain-containing protein [Planctomycetota bacterium]
MKLCAGADPEFLDLLGAAEVLTKYAEPSRYPAEEEETVGEPEGRAALAIAERVRTVVLRKMAGT